MDGVSTAQRLATSYARQWNGNDPLVDFNGVVRGQFAVGRVELRGDGNQPAYEGHVDDPFAIDHLGIHGDRNIGSLELSCIGVSRGIAVDGSNDGHGILLVRYLYRR